MSKITEKYHIFKGREGDKNLTKKYEQTKKMNLQITVKKEITLDFQKKV